MSFEKFLPRARQIVAEHKAQYNGVYVMKGGFLGEVLDNPITEIVSDVAATATGNPELIPVINAGETAAGDLVQGQSVGKSLAQGAISGGESLAGQEAAGAVGIGQGNTAFNNALGITGDNPTSLGLPNIGGAISDAASGVGNSVSNAIGSATDYLGITSPGATGAADNLASSVGSPATSATVPSSAAVPATGSSTIPGTGSGGVVSPSGADAFSQASTGSQLSAGNIGSSGPSTGSSPGLGSLGPQASSAVGATGAADNFAASVGTPATSAAAPSTGVNPSAALTSLSPSGAAAPTSTSGGGLLNTLETAGAKSAIPLALGAYEAIKGPASLPSQSSALETGGAATAPLLNTETSALNSYNSGTLTPSQAASISQGVQQQQNALIQQLASQGITDFKNNSAYISGMQQIQQWQQAQTQNYLQQSLTAGLQAGGEASSNIAGVANQQLTLDTNFQNSLNDAIGAVGSSIGGTGIGAVTNSLLNKPQQAAA